VDGAAMKQSDCGILAVYVHGQKHNFCGEFTFFGVIVTESAFHTHTSGMFGVQEGIAAHEAAKSVSG
jgi:hypothetical protein